MFNLRKDYETKQVSNTSGSGSVSSFPSGAGVAAGNPSPTSSVLLQPKTVEINGYKFVISKMPCTVAQEVLCQLPAGFLPVISEFTKSEEQLFRMLSYCERVYTDGRANVPLISKTIIDNHVPDFNTLIKLEWEVLQYNFDFFAQGRLLNFLNEGLSLAGSKASGILTDLLDKLLQAGVQLSTNLEQSTP